MRPAILLLSMIIAFTTIRCTKDESKEINEELLIKDEYDAESAAGLVNSACERVMSSLPGAVYQQSFSNTFSNQRIENLLGGYCTVNGTRNRTYSSSASYVSDALTIDITITFNNYIVYSDGTGKIESGTVEFYEYSSSATYASGGYTSNYNKSISGSNIKLSSEWVNDIISLDVTDSQGNSYILKGTVTTSRGSFSF